MGKSGIVKNIVWKLAERFGAQLISFIVSIVLARILEPEVYGKIAIISVFIAILSVFCDCGLANALIQKNDTDENDFSTVLYFNVFSSLFLCFGLYMLAPIISRYYQDDELTALIRVLCFSLPLYGIRNVQQAYISKNMLFRLFFFSTIAGTVISAVIGIEIALSGGGAWALVYMQLSLQAVDIVVLFFTTHWHPKHFFSRKRLRELFAYGGKILLSGIMETIYSNLRSLIIGKFYPKETLAFYTKGRNLPDLVGVNINNSIETVMFPVLSKSQDDIIELRKLTKKTIMTSMYVLCPSMMGIIGAADTLVVTLYGQKWAPTIPYLRLFCLYFLLFPFHTSNLNVIKALGRSDVILKQEVIKKIVGIFLLVISVRYGVFAMTISLIIEGVIALIINAAPNRFLIMYKCHEQILENLPCVLLSGTMCGIVYMAHLLPLSNMAKLVIQVLIGIVVYIIGLRLIDKKLYNLMRLKLLEYFAKNNRKL